MTIKNKTYELTPNTCNAIASAAAGGKIRFAPKAEISIINRLSLLDDNEPHQLSQDDSYQKVYDEMKRYLNIDSSSPQAIRSALKEQFPS